MLRLTLESDTSAYICVCACLCVCVYKYNYYYIIRREHIKSGTRGSNTNWTWDRSKLLHDKILSECRYTQINHSHVDEVKIIFTYFYTMSSSSLADAGDNLCMMSFGAFFRT